MWKADGLSNEEVRNKLAEQGLELSNCEALNQCVNNDFWGLCDCRCILTNKLAYKADGPSSYMRNKEEVEVRNAIRHGFILENCKHTIYKTSG